MAASIEVSLGAKAFIGLDGENKVFIRVHEPWMTIPTRITIDQNGKRTLSALKEAIKLLEVHVK